MSLQERCRYEEAKGRAICAAIRLGALFTGALALFPVGAWLMLEANGWPQAGGALLCAVAGVLASAIPDEKARAERLTRESDRLKWQGVGDQ